MWQWKVMISHANMLVHLCPYINYAPQAVRSPSRGLVDLVTLSRDDSCQNISTQNES